MRGRRTEIEKGNRFGRLVILVELPQEGYKRYFLCKCDCGNYKNILLKNLIKKTTLSCGCLSRDKHTTHGFSKSRMKKIEKEFKRGKKPLYIHYELIERTETVGLFKLFIKDKIAKEHVGWEVSRIYFSPERMIHEHVVLEHEYVTGDETFGADGSKSFFPADESSARAYLTELNQALLNKELTPVG